MDILQRHEIFEIEMLENLKSGKFLEPLVFGGGTMLRLCYELNRYSADLDFWFIRNVKPADYFKRLKQSLEKKYEMTDAWMRFHTLLFELRAGEYPKRLKIEIRKGVRPCDFQDRIAFSRSSTRQVVLRVHTLEQTMKNKIAAAIGRREIRDYFDIEFLMRRGVPVSTSRANLIKLEKVISGFKKTDFSVTLGSLLDPDMRKFYIENRFSLLSNKISSNLA